jgi:hypothetical protein
MSDYERCTIAPGQKCRGNPKGIEAKRGNRSCAPSQ